MQNSSHEIAEVLYRMLGISGFGPARVNSLLRTLQNLNQLPNPMRVSALEQVLFAHLNSMEQADFHHLILPELADLKCAFPYAYLTALDANYPDYLRGVPSAPTVFTYMGNLSLLDKRRVGFSGVRNISDNAVEATTRCVEGLVKRDVCVVSGYANGVDSTAHLTALKEGGTTILVLPYGITYFEIKPHFREVWDWNRVLVVSEFVPTYPFSPHNAMQRNDTIIRLCKALIIPEAGVKGGSQATGTRALALKHPLFVAKYTDTPAGNESLLCRGAQSLPISTDNTSVSIAPVMDVVDGAGLLF